MRIKTKASIIIIIGLILIVTSRFISAIDAPHNASNMSCGSCHGYEIFWVGTGSYDLLCQQCHKVSSCSPEGFTDTNAPAVKTHTDSNGNELAECRTCHDPHYQRQKNYKSTDPNNYYLAKGQFTACSPGSDTSTLTYSSPITYKTETGWDAARLTAKTDICRRTILFPNVNKLGYSYPIIAVDATTITVKGKACEFLSLPSNFAVIYGQYIKDSILTDEVNSTYSPVKFFDQIGQGSFAYNENMPGVDLTRNGVCQVCHNNTTHWKADGTGADHYNNNVYAEGCIHCHSHTDGFAHCGGSSPESCHGHDGGSGTTLSHSTHTENDDDDFRGPLPVYDCDECHNTSSYPKFADNQDLTNTTICNTCHSPDGGFNGVVSTGGSIGAKDNWETGVYQANGPLTSGKEKWCAGCHDNVPSVVKTKTATDIVGDNTTYGYYLDTHGNATYGVSRQGVSYSRGECLHCHDVSISSRIINESFEKSLGYDETWTEPIGNPDEDSTLPSCVPPTCTPPSGAGLQCLKSISAPPDYKAFATQVYGLEQTKSFTRMYLYVEAHGLSDGNSKPISALRNSGGSNVFILALNQSAGQLRILLRFYYNNGNFFIDGFFPISLNNWYRIEIKYDTTNPGADNALEWLVDGVSQGKSALSGLTGGYYSGIQRWVCGFWGDQTITGTIYFDNVAVKNNDWVGEEQTVGMPLHGGQLFNTSEKFCFKCHDNTTTYATTAIVNRSYSYRAGGWTSDPLDDILEAFSFASPGSSHNLNDIKTFIIDPLRSSWGYTSNSNPCGACHNPHSVQGDPANSPNSAKSPSTRGYPVVRPSEHATNYNNLWGNDAGTSERMNVISSNSYWAPKRVDSGYEPDGSSTQDGSNMANYVSLCYDCHNSTNVIWSTRLDRYLRRINWSVSGDFHGNFARLDDLDDHDFLYGYEWGDLKEPYKVGVSYPKDNYVLNCTDCHEPHGSPNDFLLRKTVNGTQIPTISQSGRWYYWCQACHRINLVGAQAHITIDENSDCSQCHLHCDSTGSAYGLF